MMNLPNKYDFQKPDGLRDPTYRLLNENRVLYRIVFLWMPTDNPFPALLKSPVFPSLSPSLFRGRCLFTANRNGKNSL